MDQIPEQFPEKILSKKLGSPNRRKAIEITVAPKDAATFKGRYPTGLRDQMIAIKEKEREEKQKVRKKAIRIDNKKKMIMRKKHNAVVISQKVDEFLAEFLKNGGNATEAAATVFNVTTRTSAASLGSYYLKKAKMLGRLYLEEHGYTYGRLLTMAAEKAETSRLTDWWDRVYEISGYGSFRGTKDGGTPPVTNINIVQTEKELFKKYALDGEVIEDETNDESVNPEEDSEDEDDLEEIPDEVGEEQE